MSIVVIGAIFVDIKGYPYAAYIPGGRNQGRIETMHGGVARNIAEDLANIGLAPTFISLTERSGLGREVLERLQERKVCTDYIRSMPDGMGTWLAVFDHEGDVVASISKRPDLRPIMDILETHGDEVFSKAESILLELDLDRELIEAVCRYAAKYRVPVYAAVSNMSIALERRDLLQQTGCFVCNAEEAGILFSEKYEDLSAEEMQTILSDRIRKAKIPAMIVTMGSLGAVFAEYEGESGIVPGIHANVRDTTGAGDAFFAGVAAGLTGKKSLREACGIGARLASSVIESPESVCPIFEPEELGL